MLTLLSPTFLPSFFKSFPLHDVQLGKQEGRKKFRYSLPDFLPSLFKSFPLHEVQLGEQKNIRISPS
jgi:hypothetical protein